MNEYKEFTDKSLDEAIRAAITYYDVPREKLEIDIVQDAKSGIFGLVGARKAVIRARRAQLPDMKPDRKTGRSRPQATEQPEQSERPGRPEKEAAPQSGMSQPAQAGQGDAAPADNRPKTAQSKSAKRRDARFKKGGEETQPAEPARQPTEPARQSAEPARQPARQSAEQSGERAGESSRRMPKKQSEPASSGRKKGIPAKPRPVKENASGPDSGDNDHDGLPRVPLAELDQALLEQTGLNIIQRLIEPIVGSVPIKITIAEDRIMAGIAGDDSGLLIGREGQNLAAIQHLAARMLSRAMNCQVRLQVDAGDYHSRQDARLTELALSLADKVRGTGKSMSTKPLSAYQRRVIHLALQDDPDVFTRSTGDGVMKRVVILRKKD